MSGETAVVTGKPYGLERVCRVLAFPRSTIYGQRQRESAKVVPLFPVRRGPKPQVPDADLLPPFALTCKPRPSPARASARSGRGCASSPVSASPAPACGA
jgi:hypothetical protein